MEYLARNGYWVVFLVVLAEQLGLPLPAAPLVIAAGALVGAGQMNLWLTVMLILVASLAADSVWYGLGRRYGARILGLLCRVSLEPDSCVRNTQDQFARHGRWLIVFSKFVPGLSTLTPPLAGVVRVGVSRFLFLDTLGILAQAVLFLGVGYALRGPFERFARWLIDAGGATAVLLVGFPVVYIAWKYLRRRLVMRELRTARVLPADLKARLDAGERVFIVDLRYLAEVVEHPTLPGALRMKPDELEHRHSEIPRDRDIILFCT